MHLRFDNLLQYWGFKQRFAEAWYYTYCKELERQRALEHKAQFVNFTEYARTYLGDDYYEALPDDSDDSDSDGSDDESFISLATSAVGRDSAGAEHLGRV